MSGAPRQKSTTREKSFSFSGALARILTMVKVRATCLWHRAAVKGRVMQEEAARIQLFVMRESAAASAKRHLLHRGDVPFQWIELGDAEQAPREAQVRSLDDKRLPVCVFPD